MKIKSYLPGFVFLFSLSVFTLNATPVADRNNNNITIDGKAKKKSKEQIDNRIAVIKLRIHEIKQMDRSGLSTNERKKLRKELRNLRKEARHMGFFIAGGIVCTLAVVMLIFA